MIVGTAADASFNQPGNLEVPPLTHRLDKALDRLAHAWQHSHTALSAKLSEREQNAEQHIQTLRVQASHWRAEAERLSTKLDTQNQFEQRAQKAEQELAYQRQSAQQWQERAESWKEEARRSEEARVAALHKSLNNQQLTAIAGELDTCLGEAIDSLRQVLSKRSTALPTALVETLKEAAQ